MHLIEPPNVRREKLRGRVSHRFAAPSVRRSSACWLGAVCANKKTNKTHPYTVSVHNESLPVWNATSRTCSPISSQIKQDNCRVKWGRRKTNGPNRRVSTPGDFPIRPNAHYHTWSNRSGAIFIWHERAFHFPFFSFVRISRCFVLFRFFRCCFFSLLGRSYFHFVMATVETVVYVSTYTRMPVAE